MNQIDPKKKIEIIKACAKTYLIYGEKSYQKSELLKKYYKGEILPSNRQLREWRVFGRFNEIIQNNDLGDLEINNDLGLWTPSFISGVWDSGILHLNKRHCFYLYKNTPTELIDDLKESKLSIKVSKLYKNGCINLTFCPFLKYKVKDNKYNYNEYLAGLFTGCRIMSVNGEDGEGEKDGEEWMVVNPKNDMTLKKIVTVLDNYKILYKMGDNGQIFISPYYGILFFGYMPIHSSTRIINVKKAYKGSKLALVYWHMVRSVSQPVAPTKAHILPFALSYASYWNRGILKKTDIREMGVEMGVIGISPELRELMKEWIKYHS